jgi:hypothetical protein
MLSIGSNLQLLVNGKYGDENYDELLHFFRGVDVLVQANVISSELATPPTTPVDGDSYIVPADATGAWTGKENQIARYNNRRYEPTVAAWEFFVPKRNWLVGVNDLGDDGQIVRYNGEAWVQLTAGGGGGGDYTLPTASASVKGGVRIGSGLSMTGQVLSVDFPAGYTLPTASPTVKGGIKVGAGLAISGDGTLSATGGGGVTDHNQLSNIGTISHAQIDETLETLFNSNAALAINVETNSNLINDLISNKQDATTTLTSLATIDLATNVGKALVVNADEDGFELVTIGGGSGDIPAVIYQAATDAVGISSLAKTADEVYSAGFNMIGQAAEGANNAVGFTLAVGTPTLVGHGSAAVYIAEGVGNAVLGLDISGDDGLEARQNITLDVNATDNTATIVDTQFANDSITINRTAGSVSTIHSTPEGKYLGVGITGGTAYMTLSPDTSLELTLPVQAGSETASFTHTNAPVEGLQITNWIAVTVNGVAGYLPFFSVSLDTIEALVQSIDDTEANEGEPLVYHVTMDKLTLPNQVVPFTVH